MSDFEEMPKTIKAVPHGELCDRALDYYREISNQAGISNSLVPKAIEYYRKWRPVAERKILHAASLTGKLVEDLTADLKDGWFFDPWLNPRGRPIIVASESSFSGFYWVLVKGSPEQIAALEPFVEFPVEELEEAPEVGFQPYGLLTDYIPFKDGKRERDPEPGFVVMHKDHVFAKGTVYTLPPGYPTLWTVARDLAKLSGYLGIDEARDVLAAILEKSSSENEDG